MEHINHFSGGIFYVCIKSISTNMKGATITEHAWHPVVSLDVVIIAVSSLLVRG